MNLGNLLILFDSTTLDLSVRVCLSVFWRNGGYLRGPQYLSIPVNLSIKLFNELRITLNSPFLSDPTSESSYSPYIVKVLEMEVLLGYF